MEETVFLEMFLIYFFFTNCDLLGMMSRPQRNDNLQTTPWLHYDANEAQFKIRFTN